MSCGAENDFNIKYLWLENICFKQLVDDTSPKP